MASLPKSLHGAYHRAELNKIVGPGEIRKAVAAGQLVAVSRGVLVDARRATEFTTRAAAAVLMAGPEAVLSGPSALLVLGCSVPDPAPVHIIVPYHRKIRPRPGVKVHQGRLDQSDVHEFDGLRVQAPELALAEVMCRATRRIALATADEALGMLAEDLRDDFRTRIEERILARPDPRGRRQGLAVLQLATGMAESPMESWMLLALVDGGLPVPVQQHSITDLAGRELYRLDFAWPELRVAVEYDGYAAHENRRDRDAARDEDLRRRGWTVIRASAEDLAAPERVIEAVRAAFRVRGLAT
ncbi:MULTISPECIES: DUF559 domain-containing protein [Amycolatopsis]|uniref:DUF559 domain-containing protein n=1 Tax=Amycolatopsis TaxID=1813 RepID=UPI00142E4AAE|nr:MULTISPECIES: DUF559 domain-containing protein [Amycolatopsis]